MLLLRSIEMIDKKPAGFPFSVPVVQSLGRIEFAASVTFFVGENGSGKSTILEAIACAARSITVGSENVDSDQTLRDIRRLADRLKLTWSKKTRKGFFMRAEDFFGYAKRMAQVREEMERDLDRVNQDYQGRSALAQTLAKIPYQREIGEMQRAYGASLDANSHGESFFKLFQARFVGEGLYLIDEPEAPLSPTRQLSLLTMIKMMVDQGGQFIIATHSPIVLAYPGATILSFDGGRIEPVDYDSLEHVVVTRDFLNNPASFLRILIAE
jgi:predicted ATPase